MARFIAAEDRKAAILLGVVVAIALGLVIFLVRTDSGAEQLPSSQGTGSYGAKAAFLLLRETGYNVRRSTENPRELTKAASNTTLVLVDPVPDDEQDIRAVREFVAKGGRLVGTGINISPFFRGSHTVARIPHFDWKVYTPQEPSDLTRGIKQIELIPQFYFSGAGSDEAPFKSGDEIPITRFQFGKGEVVWWSGSQPLTNGGISRSDNAQLLLNSVGDPKGRTVIWDEYFHEGAKTLFQTFWDSPLRWGLLQGLLIAIAVCFTWSRRFGPVRAAPATSRLATLEFVETLAELYRSAGAGNIAVQVVYERFRARLQHRYSIRRDVPLPDLIPALVALLHGSDENALGATLNEIEHAISDHSLSVRRAVELVKELHRLNSGLKLIKEEEACKPS